MVYSWAIPTPNGPLPSRQHSPLGHGNLSACCRTRNEHHGRTSGHLHIIDEAHRRQEIRVQALQARVQSAGRRRAADSLRVRLVVRKRCGNDSGTLLAAHRNVSRTARYAFFNRLAKSFTSSEVNTYIFLQNSQVASVSVRSRAILCNSSAPSPSKADSTFSRVQRHENCTSIVRCDRNSTPPASA